MIILKQYCESLLIETISCETSVTLFLSASKYKVKKFIYKHFGEVTQTLTWKEELIKNSQV